LEYRKPNHAEWQALIGYFSPSEKKRRGG